MSPKEKRDQLALCREVRFAAERAADHTSRDRDFSALCNIIAVQERQHRALGRRMVGDIGARLTVSQSVDLFVCRTIGEGLTTYEGGKAPFRRLTERYPDRAPLDTVKAAMAADYSDLIARKVG